jgi:hypothetical protein
MNEYSLAKVQYFYLINYEKGYKQSNT